MFNLLIITNKFLFKKNSHNKKFNNKPSEPILTQKKFLFKGNNSELFKVASSSRGGEEGGMKTCQPIIQQFPLQADLYWCSSSTFPTNRELRGNMCQQNCSKTPLHLNSNFYKQNNHPAPPPSTLHLPFANLKWGLRVFEILFNFGTIVHLSLKTRGHY